MDKDNRRVWSDEELDTLKSSNGIKEMSANLPNKTIPQIRSKASKMKLSVAENKWSENQLKYLVDNFSNSGAKKIAEELDKKTTEVSHKAKRLGLKYIPPHEKVDVELVIEMYTEEKRSMKEIADHYGVHQEYIRRIIPDEYKKYRLDINADELSKKYLSGTGTTLLAREYNTYPGVIRDTLIRSGIPLRSHEEASLISRINIPYNQIVSLYEYGFSMRDIGEMYNASDLTIKNRLEECRIEIREENTFYTKGFKNSNWKGGITPVNISIRCSKEYTDWRFSTFKRDNFTCQCCEDSTGGNLQAHHIYNFAENEDMRFNRSNGITLCSNCHSPEKYGSFHHTYGTTSNDIYQLQEYFDDIRSHLGLPLIKVEDIIYQRDRKVS